MKNLVFAIICLVLGLSGIGYVGYRVSHITPIVIGQNDVAVYDSLKTVLAYKKGNEWVVLNNQKTVRVLELEIYRLSSLLNQAEKINHKVKHDYDSIVSIHYGRSVK